MAITMLFVATPVLAQGEEGPRPAAPFGETQLNAGLVSWQPAPLGLRTILIVGGPGDFRFERVFGPGEAPTLRFEDALPTTSRASQPKLETSGTEGDRP